MGKAADFREAKGLDGLIAKSLKIVKKPGKAAVFLLGGKEMRRLKAIYAGKPHEIQKVISRGKRPRREVDHVRGPACRQAGAKGTPRTKSRGLAASPYFVRGTQRASASNVVDVLAFVAVGDFPHPESRDKFWGDVYINADIHKRDKKRSRYLAIHGLLHLLGYTHDKKNDTLRMEKREKELLRKLQLR